MLLEWKTFVWGIGGGSEVVKREVGRIEDKARLFSSHGVCQMSLQHYILHSQPDNLLGISVPLNTSSCGFQMK